LPNAASAGVKIPLRTRSARAGNSLLHRSPLRFTLEFPIERPLDIVGRAGQAREGVTQATRQRLIYQGLCRLKSGDRYRYSLL